MQTTNLAIPAPQAIKGALRGFAAARGGTAAVSFALIAPVLVMFVYGIIEFGRILYTQGALNYTVQETTRWAVVNVDPTADPAVIDTQVETYAISRATLVDANRFTEVNAVPVPQPDTTVLIDIEIKYRFDLLIPKIYTGPLTISAASRGFLVGVAGAAG